MPRRSRVPALALAAIFLAGACGGGSSSGDPDAAGTSAPQFRAATLAGGQIEAADLAGRDVALWFWAPF